ncbi:MAG: DUF3256 family protein [Prevotellaceae bacterium]|nr:DUF3256 family protein [Prevotella sp.]MDD7258393.1 DUF3256 family protein [Prevotellaceae bacterium]MDY6130193.1 DUF3256 family protein [Prevotella sp.]
MKRLFTAAIALLFVWSANAQYTMREAWLSMPDSILPYLNKGLRAELIDFLDMKTASKVSNLLQGESRVDTLISDFISLHPNRSTQIQLKLLPCVDSTQVICLVKTFYAPEAESEISFYTSNWEAMDGRKFGIGNIKATESDIFKYTHRPDTMSKERYEELCRTINPIMVSARLSADDDTLILSLASSALTLQEIEQIKGILKQRKFKWRGCTYKECE